MDTQGKFFWEEFLHLYKNLPCLWNSKQRIHTTKEAKNAALDLLVQKCKQINPKADRDYVTKKIHNFRCGFRRELKKVIEAKKADLAYTPTLWYFETLNFLFNNKQNVEHTEDEDDQELDFSKEIKLEEDDDSNIEIIPNHFEMTPTSDNSRLSPNPNYFSEETQTVNKPSSYKRKKICQKPEDESNYVHTNKIISIDPFSKSCENIFEFVGKKLAWDLQEINRNNIKQRIIAEKLINDVIFYAQIGALTEVSSIRTQPIAQSSYMAPTNQVYPESYEDK